MEPESDYTPVATVRHRRVLPFILGFSGVVCAIELVRGESSLSEVAGLFALLVFVLAGAFTWQAVIDGVGARAFWKAVFRRNELATINAVPTYEMYPVKRGSIRRRFTLLCWALCAACIVLAYVAKQHPEDPGPNLIWFFFAMWPGLAAVITTVSSWVITGRL